MSEILAIGRRNPAGTWLGKTTRPLDGYYTSRPQVAWPRKVAKNHYINPGLRPMITFVTTENK